MTSITPAVTSAAASSAASASTSSTSSTDSVEKQKTQFLKLLLTEMQHQDPTSPISTSEYQSQLAQYSQIEQQQNTNTNLSNILNVLQGSSNDSVLSYLNKDVTVNSAQAPVQNGDASWEYNVDGAASSVALTVTDENGSVVAQHQGNTDTGSHDFVLPGQTEGANLTLTVTALDKDGKTLSNTVYAHASVTGVDNSSGTSQLVAGNSQYATQDIIDVSVPKTTSATNAA